jgi:hypothetical protein
MDQSTNSLPNSNEPIRHDQSTVSGIVEREAPIIPSEPVASYDFLSKLYSSVLFLLASFFNLFNRKNVIVNTASASTDSSLNSDTTK